MRNEVPRPDNEQDFENQCLELFRLQVPSHDLKKVGRRGQSQHGLDLHGVRNGTVEDEVGVQCKLKHLGTQLATNEIDSIVRAVLEGQYANRLRTLIIATTAPRDRGTRTHVMDMSAANAKKGLFQIELFAWQDIEDVVHRFHELRRFFFCGISEPDAMQLTQTTRDTFSIVKDIHSLLWPDPNPEIDQLEIEFKSGRFDVVEFEARKILDTHSARLSDDSKVKLYQLIALSLSGKERWDDSNNIFMSMAELFPNHPVALATAALGYFANDQSDRALELANKALELHPTLCRAYVARINCLAPDTPVDHLAANIPEACLKDTEVLFALAEAGLHQHRFETSAHFARLATEIDPTWRPARVVLATSLMLLARDRVVNAFSGMPDRIVTEQLKEPLHIYNELLNELGEKGSLHERSVVHRNRATLHRLVGDEDAARLDLRRAWELDQANGTIASAWALELARMGRTNEAIQTLRHWEPGTNKLDVQRLLAHLLAERDDPSAKQEAIHLLEELIKTPELPPQLRLVVIQQRLEVESQLRGPACSMQLLDSSFGRFLSSVAAQALRANCFMQMGQLDQANFEIEKCASVDPHSLSDVERTWIAELLLRLDRVDEAIRWWHTLLVPGAISLKSLEVLGYAINHSSVRSIRFVLDFTKQVREAGLFDSRIARLELSALAKLHEWDDAIALASSYAERLVDDADILLAQATIAELAGRPELVAQALNRRADDDSLTSPQVADWTRLIALHEGSGPALEFAYKYWRKDRSHQLLCQALVTAFLHPYRADQAVAPERVCIVAMGHAVTIRDTHSDQVRTIVLEDRDPEESHQEFGTDSSWAKELIGRSIGDNIAIRGYSYTRRGVIEGIARKEAFAARDLAEHWPERFPSVKFVESYPTNAIDSPDASGIDPQVALRDLVEPLRTACESQEAIIRAYAEGRMPIAMVARVWGGDVIRTMNTLTESPIGYIRCARSAPEDVAIALDLLDRSSSIVIGSTAVATLIALDECKWLTEIGRKVYVPRPIFDQLRELRNYVKLGLEHGLMDLGYRAERIVGHFTPPDQVLAFSRSIEQCEEILRKVGSPIGGRDLLKLENRFGSFLLNRCEPGEAIAFAFARGNDVVSWSDDGLLYAIESTSPPARVWTQLVLEWIRRRQDLPRETFDDASIRLVLMRYLHTWVRVAAITKAFQSGGWNAQQKICTSMLDFFRQSPPQAAVLRAILVHVLRTLWLTPILGPQSEDFVFKFLDAVSTCPSGLETISAARQLLQGAFGLDVSREESLMDLINRWRKSRLIR